MVVLHSLDAKAAAGVTRYARDLEAALRTAGEPVTPLRLRPWELPLGRRRVGGFLSLRLQSAFRPLRKTDLLHSTYHYAAHPRCDVATVHDLFPETRPDLGFAAAERAAMRRTTGRLARRKVHLACVSQATRDALLAHRPDLDPDRIHVAAPGVAARFAPAGSQARRHPAFMADRFNVLCVADLNPRKRFDWLLQAAADRPGIRIVHVGPQAVRRPAWQRQADLERPLARALGSRLVRLGRLDDTDLVRCYQSADLLVLPTLDEGFGFPPLEALSCGTPVAVTDLPVLRESLGQQGDFFDGPDDLAVLLDRLSSRVPTQAQRRERHAWVQANHSWGRAAQAMQAVYAAARRQGAGRRA